MKRKPFVIQTVLLAVAVSMLFLPTMSAAEVRVSVSLPLPSLVIPAPPSLAIIPGSYVYYPPDVDTNIFFYHGNWYRPHGGRWYRAADYNGPWHAIALKRVPHAVVGVPHNYRHHPIVHQRAHYRDVRTHWRTWERDRHWDQPRHERRDERRHEYRGHGPGQGR